MTAAAPIRAAAPPVKCFMVLWGIGEVFGGMTTMALQRSGMFGRVAGIDAPVLTFAFKPDYERVLDTLRSSGKLDRSVRVLNPYYHYRAIDLDGREADAELARVPEDQDAVGSPTEELDVDGRVFVRLHWRPSNKTVAYRDYLRADGTTYLRDESPRDSTGLGRGRYLTLLRRDGTPVRRWDSTNAFYRDWMLELAGGEPTAFIVDSNYVSGLVAPLRQPHILKLRVLHNSHVSAGGDPVRGKLGQSQRPVHDDVNSWDGLVFLTDGHRRDYELRFGTSSNLFTVSNPRERQPQPPNHAARVPGRGVVLARLASQKNLTHAVRVVAMAREEAPNVVLDIYGKGDDEEKLRDLIHELRAEDVVHLRGYAPRAAEELDSASFSLLTSRFEGQPLSLLESMGHGCPPVSYDINYGPSDIITDGENGFLVPAGDVAAAARRVVQLCGDQALVERMGDAAWHGAERFSEVHVFEAWAGVLGRAWDQRAERSRVEGINLLEQEYHLLAGGGFEIACDLFWTQSAGRPFEEEAVVELVAVPRSKGPAEIFPVRIEERLPGRIRLVVPAAMDGSQPEGAGDPAVDLFIRVRSHDVLKRFRLGPPLAPGIALPYWTAHKALSLQRLED